MRRPALGKVRRVVFELTAGGDAAGGGLAAQIIKLNGRPLSNVDASAAVLEKAGRMDPASPGWSLPSRSYGFAVFDLPPGAAPACAKAAAQ